MSPRPHPQDGVPDGYRRCCTCKEVRGLDKYGPAKTGPLGRDRMCRPCRAERSARYRRKHPDKVTAYAKSAQGRAVAAASMRRRRAADPARARAAYRAYREAHPDKTKEATARWRIANPDYGREWDRANAEKRRVYQLRRRRAVRAVASVPFTGDQLSGRLSMFKGCWICGDIPTEVDHVKPVSKGGLHILANLRPACRSCNAKKGDRWPFVLQEVA